jgi:hypothetical protein
MLCPACGHEQPEAFECASCGIVFAKHAEHQARLRGGQGPAVTGWRRPLGRTTRVVRSLAGLGALAIALLMYLNGSALRAFGPYVAMVLFGLAGLYLLVSFLERVTLGRLMVETLVLGLASAGLYVALPDVFSLRKPLYEGAIHEALPTEARTFLGVARGHIAGIGRFLDARDVPTAGEGEALIKAFEVHEGLVPGFERLPGKDQALMQGVYLRLRALDPLLQNLSQRLRREIPSGPAAWLPAVLAADVRGQLARAAADLDGVEADVARREALVETSRAPTH